MTTSELSSFFQERASTHDNGGEVKFPLTNGSLERFVEKIAVHNPDECWLWTASKTHDGYGKFWDGEKLVPAHRFSYELAIGSVPAGLILDHVAARGCTNRHCVNPAHLEAVTQRENLMRGDTIQARNAAKTHCIHGHEFTDENTYVDKRGCRSCWTCKRGRMARVAA